eukprot:snap_masked-scaffold_6-processed-gene-6.25-mRNA-1 protein AED:1.00 eAED:1.00 QI:0/-1/0/0/-1/1/1/0/59
MTGVSATLKKLSYNMKTWLEIGFPNELFIVRVLSNFGYKVKPVSRITIMETSLTKKKYR